MNKICSKKVKKTRMENIMNENKVNIQDTNKKVVPKDLSEIYPGVMNVVANNIEGQPTNTSYNCPDFVDSGSVGWPIQFISNAGNSGIDYIRFVISPNTSFPIHGGDDPSIWFCSIILGYGQLIIADNERKEISRVDYKAGDFISLQPNCWHGWENGKEPSDMIVIRRGN